MESSPFSYGTTVSNHAFTNREEETDRLKKNLLNGINTMIISPRRWGKSSLVEKVIGEIQEKEKKVRTVSIDLFLVNCEEEFLELFAREVIRNSSNRLQDWISTGKEFFSRLVPTFSYGIDPANDFKLSFDWKEIKKHSEEILNLPELIARKKGIQFIICLDEFQNISSFEGFPALEKRLRSVWQRQKSVTYCLYGSKRHMMEDIFNNSSKPFYRFGDIMMLPKISAEKWVPFIRSGFEKMNKSITEEAAWKITQLMQNHSWYVQQLSHYTLHLTRKKAGEAEVMSGLEELLQANSPLYQREIELLSATQINLLRAICAGENQLTSAAIMQKYKLGTPNNVTKNKSILFKNDIVEESEGKIEFLDPAFEIWLRKKLMYSSK